MAKTTREERLTAARALVAKYEREIASEKIANNVAVGDAVTIKFGRGQTSRQIEGSIVGLKDTDQGRIVAVVDGDLNTFRVHVRDIVTNAGAVARADAAVSVEEQGVGEDVNEAEAAAEAASDPLAEA